MAMMIDLRSDTVTQPTPLMREAICEAEVGDDVYGEDPTVNRLEELGAEMLGKEASLFTASGTMSNLVSILTHTQRGDEMIVGNEAHIFFYEVGGAAALGGVHVRAISNRGGTLDPHEVEDAIRGDNIHFPRTRLVCLENTHNRCGGVALTAAQTEAVADVAHGHGAALHMDGARIFNAAVALGVNVRELVRSCDSVSVSLSKGLSAPVGSLLAGSRDFVAEARRYRKMVGGGMRQAGVLAAAGIVGLEQMVGRLAEDHANAKALAEGIASLPGVQVDLDSVQTNIVVMELSRAGMQAEDFIAAMAARGVLTTPFGGSLVRMVTHNGISRGDVETACRTAREVLAAGR